MNEADFLKSFQIWDEWIRAGRVADAAGEIRRLNLAQVPRAQRLPLARLCRRSGAITSGIHLLRPLIRGERERDHKANWNEISEYAALLTRIGLIDEALHLLSGVKTAQAPESELFKSYCHIMRWDYLSAIPHLKTFILGEAEPYMKQIARVNLAAGLVATREWQEAESLLSSLIQELEASQARRLLGNCLELRGQVYLGLDDIARTRADLEKAGEIFTANGSYDLILVKKWLAYLEARKAGSTDALKKFRAMAIQKRHWESVREADFLALKVEFQQASYDHLYFGTPFPAYRQRIEAEIDARCSSHFDWGGKQGVQLDLLTGEVRGRIAAPPPRKLHRLMSLLLEDFYVPIRTGPLFAGLYPEEYYDPHSSPLRVRQVMRRLRRWMEEQHLPLSVVTERGAFRLKAGAGFAIRVPAHAQVRSEIFVDVEKLKGKFAPGVLFQMNHACQELGLSRSSFHRLAQKMIDQGELERVGVGKATRYRIAIAGKAAA